MPASGAAKATAVAASTHKNKKPAPKKNCLVGRQCFVPESMFPDEAASGRPAGDERNGQRGWFAQVTEYNSSGRGRAGKERRWGILCHVDAKRNAAGRRAAIVLLNLGDLKRVLILKAGEDPASEPARATKPEA